MNLSQPNIIFMGTPEFAVPTLEALHNTFSVKAVVSTPDKPQGRGLKLIPSPIKSKALELSIPVITPNSLKDNLFIDELYKYKPDIIVVLAFKILPTSVYNISSLATFNIHASILPKYRGAAPINWAIINGDSETGLTTFLLQEKVDTGDIILQKKVPIPKNSTAGILHDLLMPLSADIAIETCNLILSNNYNTIIQDNSKASPAPKIFPDMCKINWNNDASNVKHFIHGLSPYPGAWTIWNNKRLKILKVSEDFKPNNISGNFCIKHDSFIVNCGTGSIHILELQTEGKRVINIQDFLRGYRGELKGRFE